VLYSLVERRSERRRLRDAQGAWLCAVRESDGPSTGPAREACTWGHRIARERRWKR